MKKIDEIKSKAPLWTPQELDANPLKELTVDNIQKLMGTKKHTEKFGYP